MQTETVIQARELTKQFGDFTAVNRISFDVHQGRNFRLSKSSQRGGKDYGHAYAVWIVYPDERSGLHCRF
ncbi:MAG: hypothetical protein R2795_23440 [Saprospiraceae bacterium]